MSTPFYDLASLVVVPSGYKASKVYAQKPLTTDGQLAFTRSTTATRVGPDGLIEKVRTNLALYSEDYTNAYWTKGNVTLTANSIANPVNGATTAETITPTAVNDSHYLRSTPLAMSASTEVSQSIYAKANGYNYVMLEGYDGSNNPKIMFNMSDGSFSTISSSGSPVGSVEALANGWYRLKMTWQTQAGSPNVYQYYFSYDNASGNAFAGNGTSGVYFFGAQLEYGVTTDYIATTSAAVSVGPVANVPRLDYLNSSCPRLLLEPQRTNLGLWSEQFNNAGWTNAATTITANYGVSPDGYTNADRFQQTTIGALQQTISVTASTAYTVSFYCKLLGGTSASLGVYNFAASNFIFQDNLFSSLVLNQWVRVTRTFTTPVGCTSITGELWRDSTIDCLVYGFQMEAGAYATSYIPTLGAAVTRGADAASKTGISSLIGQTEGTFFAEVTLLGNTGNFNVLNTNNSTTNAITLHIEGSQVRGYVYANSSLYNSIIGGSVSVGNTYKMAYAYKSGDAALYLNGVQIGTASQTWAFSASVDKIELADPDTYFSYQEGIKFAQAILFPTRLQNSDLAALTA